MLFELQPIFINMKNLEKKNPWNIKKLVQFFQKTICVCHIGLFFVKRWQKISKKKKRVNIYVCMYVCASTSNEGLKISGTSLQLERTHDDSLW
jgi:hypothetical protein